MNTQDNRFFEEYKRLDKLCSDMYATHNGVSAYLTDMEEQAQRGLSRVPDWNADYKKLKHVRWVRNQIAHEAGAGAVSEAADLAFVRSFHRRILAGKDPLSRARKASAPRRKAAPRRKKRRPARLFFFAILLVLIFLYIVWSYFY